MKHEKKVRSGQQGPSYLLLPSSTSLSALTTASGPTLTCFSTSSFGLRLQ